MKISREDVLRVAELAHLELSAEEIELYRNQLDAILSYIGKLQELDVTGVEPLAQVLKSAAASQTFSDTDKAKAFEALRDDTLRECHTASEVLKNAPDAAAPFFRVPKVIER